MEAQGPRQHHRAKVSSKWHHPALHLPTSYHYMPTEVLGPGSWNASPKQAARSKLTVGGELWARGVSKAEGKGCQWVWYIWQHG